MKIQRWVIVATSIVVVLMVAGIVIYSKAVKEVPNDGINAKTNIYENIRGIRFCEIFLIGGNAISGNLAAAVYNTTQPKGCSVQWGRSGSFRRV